jgi:hypothetical protein
VPVDLEVVRDVPLVDDEERHVPFGTVFFVSAKWNSAGLPAVTVTADTRPAPVAGSAEAETKTGRREGRPV